MTNADEKGPTEEQDLARRALELGRKWEQRARSASRDFYVASHPGWDDEDAWARQASADVTMMLYGLDPERIVDWQLLEIGCGVGRFAPELAARMGAYTGFDIAPSMVAEAQRRHASLANARFFTSDGAGVPVDAADRAYDMILAFAVFIHCPKPIIAANVKSAFELLAPGGQLRFQVRADPDDRAGIVSLEAASQLHEQMLAVEDAITAEQAQLLGQDDYMGHAFRYAELGPWLENLTGGRATLVRIDLASIYGWVE